MSHDVVNGARLTVKEIDSLRYQGYEVGELFTSMSSIFYPLIKDNKKYLLKMDITSSGSLQHQFKLSLLQAKLKLPHIHCIDFQDEHTHYLIMEKFDSVESLKKSQTRNRVFQWGQYLKKVHLSLGNNFMLWDVSNTEQRHLCKVSFKNTISVYTTQGLENIIYLNDKKDKKLVRDISNYIHNNVNKFDTSKSFIHGDMHRNNIMIVDDQVVIFDPNGIVLYGSPYIDIATVAFEYPGYFNSEWNRSENDKEMFECFLEGYGQVDFQQLYLYICVRGVQRYRYKDTNFLKNIDKVTKYAYEAIR